MQHSPFAMSKKKERLALIANVRKFWDSLDTHLDWTIERTPAGRDTRKFHVETAIEYCEDMLRALRALR
jgi:hypothetical protein